MFEGKLMRPSIRRPKGQVMALSAIFSAALLALAFVAGGSSAVGSVRTSANKAEIAPLVAKRALPGGGTA